MISDPLADMLTRIRNAQMIGSDTVRVLGSNQVERVLEVLSSERFIGEYKREPVPGRGGFDFIVNLRYGKSGRPVIRECRRVSRSGRRVYARVDELKRVRAGLGISILSTPQGVMTDTQARKAHVGGEILMTVS
jgi:small subunit ribosomal protein S8